MLGWEWDASLDRMISRDLTEKVTFCKDPREVRELATDTRRAFWTEGTVSAKALKRKHAWYVQGTSKRPVRLEWKERE